MELIRNFTQLNKGDSALAGGKGASLGEMTQAGINVPPGFVVLSESFEQFLRETDLIQEIDSILHSVKHEQIHTVDAASESIRALILSREMPKDIAYEIEKSFKELNTKYVAVRSSATAEDGTDHAWAGQLESYLNTQEDDVLTKVKLCWSSLFTPRAIFYRFEKGLHTTKISVAVVVQKMVESEVSGIAFSVHPVTEDRNQLIIEAGFGLGEAIVSGSVTPDSYVVEKDIKKIIDINVSTQERGLFRSENASVEHGNNEWKEIAEPQASSQVLTEAQILELSDMIIHIENHYGFPCDIEWAYEAGKFYIVQSRPITTLSAVSGDAVPVSKSDFAKFSAIAQKRTWRKDWEGTFSILLSSMSTAPYFANLKEEFGVNIDNTITTHKNGLASCFISIEDEKIFGDEMAKRVIANPTLLDEWSERTKSEYDEVFKIIPLSVEEVMKKENINTLVKHVQIFTAYLAAIKYVSNFLDKDLVAKHGQSMIEARLYTEKIFPSLEILTNNISEYIGKKEGYNPELIPALFTSELLSYVENGKLPEQSMLEVRKKMSAYLHKDTVLEIIGTDVADIENLLYGHHTDTLYGTGVYPGKVIGKVKVILEFGKEHTKFEEGDVLVSGMTDPNFVPLMKKAKAIITDGGGMLCHAAIVSRELGVPCIIGTGKATRVLKDGDMVEVDADNGTVRVLNELQIVDSLKNIDWDVQRFNAYPFFLSSAAVLSGFKLAWGLSYKHFLSISYNKNIEFHYDKSDYKEIGKVFWEKVQGLGDMQKLIEEYRSTYIAVAEKAFYEESVLNQLSVSELKSLLQKQVDRLSASGGIAHIIECASHVGEYKLVNEHHLDPHTIKAFEISFLKKAEMFAHELIESEEDDNQILEKFNKKYGWIQSSYLGRNEISIEFIKELAQKDNEDQFNANDSLRQNSFLEMLSHLFSWQDERKANLLTSIYYSQPVLDMLADRLGISRESMRFLLPEEIEKIEDVAFQKELVDRSKIFVDYAPKSMERTLLTGKSAEDFIKNFSTAIDHGTSLINGQSAFPGKATGVVRVCLSLEAIDNFKEGEILVASMTRPEYVPAMKKAVAFITDEGGITCHAAIIAREMKKPCVIGTKNATQIIKDGDMVEVDANNGTVRIIS